VLLKEQLVLTTKLNMMQQHAESVKAKEQEAKLKIEALIAEREGKLSSAA